METERRGITSEEVFKERSTLVLDKSLQTKRKSEMSAEERVRDFQRKLYRKAKQDKSFRFYVLYDKVRLTHFLKEAYRRVKKKGGSAGIDGVTFQEIEKRGVFEYLSEIQKELKTRTYRPQPVKRVRIPKADGGERKLGIPTIKDRIVQMSCKMVIEPIFEADFENCSYGFRPNRSSAEAVKAVKEKLRNGKTEILDADLSQCFDTIPHKKLMILLGKRISDKNILHLIKMWLKAPIVEDKRYGGGKKNKVGTPQGSVISPLLANIYLNLIDKVVNSIKGLFKRYGVEIIRYADDFILLGREMNEKIQMKLSEILKRLELNLNEKKTKRIKATEKRFEFLGFQFSYDQDIYGRDKKYLNIYPSPKSMKKIKSKIKTYLETNGMRNPQRVVKDLNSIIRGWLNYFTIERVSYPSETKRKLRYYLLKKLYRYYARKSQRKCRLYNQGAFQYLVDKYGLIDPTKYI